MRVNAKDASAYCRDVTRQQAKNFYYAFLSASPQAKQFMLSMPSVGIVDIADELIGAAQRNKRLAAMAGRVGPVLCWDTDASYYSACVTTGHCHLYDSQQYFEELIRGVEMDLISMPLPVL